MRPGATAPDPWREDRIDGAGSTGEAVADAARTYSFAGGPRLVVVADSDALKEPDALAAILGPPRSIADLPSVCVLLAKGLDERKRLSKALLAGAAVVECEPVAEVDREAWISHLAAAKGVALGADVVDRLRVLEPWTLDGVAREIEKFVICSETGHSREAREALAAGTSGPAAELYLRAIFERDRAAAIRAVAGFADRPEESFPLLGLLAWNVRQLALFSATGRTDRVPPFAADRLRSWRPLWKMAETLRFQRALGELDFGLKQTRLVPLGLWTALACRFCR